MQQAVAGIRSTTDLHHTNAYGLIDSDGMSSEQIADRQSEGVYALPVFSIEALYYDHDVVKAVAERQAATMAVEENRQWVAAAGYLTEVVTGVTAALSVAGSSENLQEGLQKARERRPNSTNAQEG